MPFLADTLLTVFFHHTEVTSSAPRLFFCQNVSSWVSGPSPSPCGEPAPLPLRSLSSVPCHRHLAPLPCKPSISRRQTLAES